MSDWPACHNCGENEGTQCSACTACDIKTIATLTTALAEAKAAHVVLQEDAANQALQAFIQGAQWWEFRSTGGTLWASDRATAFIRATEMAVANELGATEAVKIVARTLARTAAEGEDDGSA